MVYIFVLNEAQREAAEHFTGPALTLAGPGSGKTRVMTERTLMLAERTGDPGGILSVTFTNAAANEMRTRFIQMRDKSGAGNTADEPVFKTVHSYCNSVLKKYEQLTNTRYTRIEGSCNTAEQILKDIYLEINGDDADEYTVGQIRSALGRTEKPDVKNIGAILKKYIEYKRKNNLIDFDDMVAVALDILNSDSREGRIIRSGERERFKFIQVDEAQDLTREQFDVLQMISGSGNIFVVADDDQSIYGFRGAEPSCLKEFTQKNPDCKIYRLSRNYRSVKSIVTLSERFISKNTDRFEKSLYSENEKGSIPRIKACRDIAEQTDFVYGEIKKLRKMDPGMTFGILYRNNISGLAARALFSVNSEEYSVSDASLKIGSLPFMDNILSGIRNAERSGILLPTPSHTFRRMLEKGFEREFELYCRRTRQHLRYKDAVISLAHYLCGLSASWKEMLSIIERADDMHESEKECAVSLSTVHSSKGLEYDTVFIIDAVRGEFPGEGADRGAPLEEERRLFYVALTRAKKYAYVTYPLKRGNPYGKKELCGESIFVSELKGAIRAVK